jgi:hypothetical protein
MGLYAEPGELLGCLDERYISNNHPHQGFCFLFQVGALTDLLANIPASNESQI